MSKTAKEITVSPSNILQVFEKAKKALEKVDLNQKHWYGCVWTPYGMVRLEKSKIVAGNKEAISWLKKVYGTKEKR